MSSSDEARKGLRESVVGKAKEVVGAILHDEALTEEGQVEHAAGEELRQAGTADTIAARKAAGAREEIADRHGQAQSQRHAVAAQTHHEVRSAQESEAQQQRGAERVAQAEEQTAHHQAARDASARIDDAVLEADARRASADAAERQAQLDADQSLRDADLAERAADVHREEA